MRQARAGSMSMAALALVAAICVSTPSHAQEAVEINAFSVWTGQGHVVETGPGKATVTVVLSGLLFVETDEGPVDTGVVTCPAVIEVDLGSGTQTGKGNCTFTAHDGARLYSEFTCEGVHLVGCRGEFHVTGGVARFQGITGTGSILVRGRLHEYAKRPGALVTTESMGIAVWRDLKLTMK